MQHPILPVGMSKTIILNVNNMHTLLIPEDQKHYVNGLIQADLLSYNLVK